MLINRKLTTNLTMLLELMPVAKGITATAVRSLRHAPYLWDPWILQDDDVYRLFYLTTPKPDSSVPFWSQGTICGAISTDLVNWKPTGVVLEASPENKWESGRMLAGSTYKENGIYYLFYSASGGGDFLKEEKIGLATSTDGLHWERHSPLPIFSLEDCSQWYGDQKEYEEEDGHFHWRDPYIVKDENTGKYYMFICAYFKEGFPNKHRACIAVAVADKMAGPYQLLPPAAGPSVNDDEEWPFVEMERPQILYRNGKYHLFFSCWPWNIHPSWKSKFDPRRIRESSLYWYVSDKITGPFKPVGDTPIVKNSEATGLYGTNFLPLPGKPGEFMAIGWYHRLHTLQVSPKFKVDFSDDSIEIKRTYNFL
jgi:beta-fructofuranosidase